MPAECGLGTSFGLDPSDTAYGTGSSSDELWQTSRHISQCASSCGVPVSVQCTTSGTPTTTGYRVAWVFCCGVDYCPAPKCGVGTKFTSSTGTAIKKFYDDCEAKGGQAKCNASCDADIFCRCCP